MLLPTILAACESTGSPPPGTTPGAPCPDGRASVRGAPDAAVERWVPGTVVETCEDGPHRETWPAGTPAATGERRAGRRAGTWTRWTPDGRFDGQLEYDDQGVPAVRREPSSDGRLAEYTFTDGRLVKWRGVPATAMPEWVDGAWVPGQRYATEAP